MCFMVMNLLSFWAMRHVSATGAVVLLQSKLPMTVLWSTLLLKRKISGARSVVLLLVSVGTLGVALEASAPSSGHDAPARIGPVLALLCETFISGFSAVGAHVSTQQPVGAERPAVRHCTWSLAVVDANGVFVAALSAAGGLLVALTLKFVGSIEKTVVTLTAVVSIGVIEGVLLRRMPSHHFVLHSASATDAGRRRVRHDRVSAAGRSTSTVGGTAVILRVRFVGAHRQDPHVDRSCR